MTIAIAEDNALLREVLEEMFRQKGLEVIVTAENGKLLIEQFTLLKKLPVFLLCDIQMPVMNGYETILYVKKHYPSICVVAFSTNTDSETRQKALEQGAAAFISKHSDMDAYIGLFRELAEF